MTYRRKLMGLFTTAMITAAILLSLTYHTASRIRPDESILPDAYMENVNAVILDKVGKVSMIIVTPKMVHFAKDDTTTFSEPQLTIYHQSSIPWFISSKSAKATNGMDQVLFQRNVTVHHPADFNNPATVIKTTELTVHPNDKTAETEDLITMVQPSTVIKAVGMFADMNSGNIKLLSQAKGEYLPD